MISVFAKLFSIIYMINVSHASFDGNAKDVAHCHYYRNLVEPDYWLGNTQRAFCDVFHPGSDLGIPLVDNLLLGSGLKDDKVSYCENVFCLGHLFFVTEPKDKVKEFAEYCKWNHIFDLGCTAIIDHFDQYCFDVERFMDKVKDYIRTGKPKDFFFDFYKYKIKYDDWDKFTNDVINLETCTSELNDAEAYESNVTAIETYIDWTDGKDEKKLSCSCNIIIAIREAVESRILEIKGESDEEKLSEIFDHVCLSNLPEYDQKLLNKISPDKYVGYFLPRHETPLPITPEVLLHDLVMFANAGWYKNRYSQLPFLKITEVVNYFSDDHVKKSRIVEAALLGNYDISEIRSLAVDSNILKRNVASLRACAQMISKMVETLSKYYVKDGFTTDVGVTIKPQKITKAYNKKIQELIKRILYNDKYFDETFCKFADIRNEIWLKNVLYIVFNPEFRYKIISTTMLAQTTVPAIFNLLFTTVTVNI